MKALRKVWLLIAICVLMHSAATHAAELGSYSIVKLSYGANQVDINNDGIPDIVFFAWRENYNAHSFDVVTFYIQTPSTDSIKPWNIVPLFKKEKESLTLGVSGGADCVMNDFRLLKPKKSAQSLLIVAKREYSESFYEENFVDFHYYNLVSNAEGEMGRPIVYFDYKKTVRTKNKYCDVNHAFRSELGLENYMERKN